MLADAATGENDPPLVLTMAAVDRLSRLLEETGETASLLRIEAHGDHGAPSFDFALESAARSDDVVLDFARIRVLLNRDTNTMLRGFELDHRDDDQGERFVIRRSE